jgi:hypothetical protein
MNPLLDSSGGYKHGPFPVGANSPFSAWGEAWIISKALEADPLSACSKQAEKFRPAVFFPFSGVCVERTLEGLVIPGRSR